MFINEMLRRISLLNLLNTRINPRDAYKFELIEEGMVDYIPDNRFTPMRI